MNFFLVFLSFPLFLCVNQGSGVSINGGMGENPFSLKAYMIRYWQREIHNNIPLPDFLISKLSPLTTVEFVKFTKLAADNSLATHITSFCSSAKLFCFSDLDRSLEQHSNDSNFVSYGYENFTNYGNDEHGGLDSFKNYSSDNYSPLSSFQRYSRGSVNHKDKFNFYGSPSDNVAHQSFQSYAGGATGGSGEFNNYDPDTNVPYIRFTSYADGANGRSHLFSTYTVPDANGGSQSFTSYGQNGNAISNEFRSYGNDSNVPTSNFKNYGEHGNAGNDSFTSYGFQGNVPENNFKNYGADGNAGTESFSSYRDRSNVGDDSFESYGKKSNAEKINFVNYGQSNNAGTPVKFTGYGEKAKGQEFGFKIYGVNNTFKQYAEKKNASFSSYAASNSNSVSKKMSGNLVNKWVEPGKFFRESMLKEGTVMPMPDIRDKMPVRSFLPRSIVSKIPFSSSMVAEITKIFHANEDSTMEKIIKDALSECERPPTVGETKHCVSSIEDMIDFATSVLGKNVTVRTTENVNGSKEKVMVGLVKGINGGKVTESVSCHQSLYPFLMYYCHSVPKVRVYEANLLDPVTKIKINHGVAICHLDTSVWSPTHGAFVALGSSPGRIEVCHWIFENDMTWAIAD